MGRPLAEVRHDRSPKEAKSFRISLGSGEVCTTFALSSNRPGKLMPSCWRSDFCSAVGSVMRRRRISLPSVVGSTISALCNVASSAMIAGVAAAHHRVVFRRSFRIRARQIVKQHIELGSEQLTIALLEMPLQLRLVRQNPYPPATQISRRCRSMMRNNTAGSRPRMEKLNVTSASSACVS